MKRRDWTEEDDNLLRELAPKLSLQRIGVRMKRKNTSVTARARQLNITVSKARRLPYWERLIGGIRVRG